MKRYVRSTLSLLVLTLLVLTGCEQEQFTSGLEETERASSDAYSASKSAEDVIPDQYIVVFNDRVADVPGTARRAAAAQNAQMLFVYEHALKGFAFKGSARAAEALENNPNVAYVEQDQVVYAIATQNNATWGLDRIDQRDLPLSTTYSYNSTASNVNAYIIDTGIRKSHDDFSGRVGTSTTSYFDAFGGNGDDGNGHGTHVAGTVGGSTYGVAKGVNLYAVRVLDDGGSGTTSGVIAGIDWVTANHVKPAVANMSLGGGASTSLDNAVRNSVAAGITYAVAAGNGNFIGREDDACKYSPARVAEALTVGATDNTDRKTSWSNYGDCVDIFAPGANITSGWHTSNTATNTISGTSMASPHVAGVAALYLAANPGASPAQVASAIHDASTKGVVSNSRTTNDHLLYSLFDGGTTDPPANEAPTASFTFSCAELACTFDASGSTDDGTIVNYAWDFGDGDTASGETTSHSFRDEGTYTVELTVTDGGGLTNVTSQQVGVMADDNGGDPPSVSFELTAEGEKVRGTWTVTLTWSGSDAGSFDVYRDGSLVAPPVSGGSYTDEGAKGGTPVYQVCEGGTSTCSNTSSP